MYTDLPIPIVCLAPMAGITDSAYRQIVRELNPEIVLFSEFTSINGIKHSEVVRDRLNFKQSELPYIVQIFGNEPELFAKTVQLYSDSGVTGIDINMGCPAKKIIKSCSGGSLMRERDLSCQIVDACAKNTSLPISVKTRLGWTDSSELIEYCQALINAGAQRLSIHGRTYAQRFKGNADWTDIYRLKEEVTVPVIGNGDLQGKNDGEKMIGNLDGYMIGRASIGNPWVFWSDSRREKLSLKDKVEVMIKHFQLVREIKEEKRALIEFRKHISGYIRGFENAKTFRSLLMNSQTENEFIKNASSLEAK